MSERSDIPAAAASAPASVSTLAEPDSAAPAPGAHAVGPRVYRKLAKNIGWSERRKRLWMALAMSILGVGLAVGLIVAGVDVRWRLTVALPQFVAGLGFFQAQAKTCVWHAARGSCKMDQQAETKITDPLLQQVLTSKARGVVIAALAFAGLFTAAVTVLPF